MTTPYRFHASPRLTTSWNNFRFAKDDGVATVTLDRPEKMNPLTFESYADLRDLLAELPHHQDVRALVIRGEGKGFCGGGDVEGRRRMGRYAFLRPGVEISEGGYELRLEDGPL